MALRGLGLEAVVVAAARNWHVGVLPACMPPHPVRAWCPQRPEEDVSAPGTAVVDGCEFHVGAESQTSVLWKSSGL